MKAEPSGSAFFWLSDQRRLLAMTLQSTLNISWRNKLSLMTIGDMKSVQLDPQQIQTACAVSHLSDESVSAFTFTYFHGLAGLEALRPIWDHIFRGCRNSSFHNDWRWHFSLQKYLIQSDVCYVYVSKGEEAVAVLPLQLVVRRYGPIKRRILILPYHVAVDLSDILVVDTYRDVPFLGGAIEYLRSNPPCPWDMVQLTQFTERSCLVRQVDLIGASRIPMGRSAYVASTSSDIFDQISKKQIKNVRRHLRNAETSFGGCTFAMAENEADVLAKYQVFLEVEASGWKGDEGTKSAILFRPDARTFYRETLKLFGKTGQAVVGLLAFGGQPVAAQIGLRTGRRLSLLKIGFDEKYRDYGPGSVALLMCMDAEKSGTRELSLVTCPPWSDRWHFNQEEKFVFEVFNRGTYAQLIRLTVWMGKKVKPILVNARERIRRFGGENKRNQSQV